MDVVITAIDGVLTNEEGRLDREASYWAGCNAFSRPVVCITDRSWGWVHQTHIPQFAILTTHPNQTREFSRFMIFLPEYGAAHTYLDSNRYDWHTGGRKFEGYYVHEPWTFLKEKIAPLQGVYVDNDAQTLLTIRPYRGRNSSESQMIARDFRRTRIMMRGQVCFPNLEFTQTPWACHWGPAGLNKEAATIRGLEMIKLSGFEERISHAHVLGYDPSDLDLTIPLDEGEIPYTFYFVGDARELGEVQKRGIVTSKKPGAKGAAEILSYIYKSGS